MKVLLREATESDLELIMAWRSNPVIYEGFYSQIKSLTWEEHLNWWETQNKDAKVFIVIFEGRKVGVVRVNCLSHWAPEIGWYIGEVSLWGKGIGKEAVRLGLDYIKSQGKEYARTTILDSNERGIRLAKSLGFEKLSKAREKESWWQIKL